MAMREVLKAVSECPSLCTACAKRVDKALYSIHTEECDCCRCDDKDLHKLRNCSECK